MLSVYDSNNNIETEYFTGKRNVSREYSVAGGKGKVQNKNIFKFSKWSGLDPVPMFRNTTYFLYYFTLNLPKAIFTVQYKRDTKAEVFKEWRDRRNTGMSVAWSYSGAESVTEDQARQHSS